MIKSSVADRSYRGKRVFDLAVLALAAIPSIAVGTACALVVRATSRGPVFFRQERVGLRGEPFRVWKFRTMVDEPDLPILPDASQITSSGRWLRRYSLDELPQLINVLRGEMSIVGPRPTLAYQVERYDRSQLQRLSVRPGLTGLAQVAGRNQIPWAARIAHDLDYVDRQSVVVDVQVLIATIRVVLSGAGVGGHPTDDPLARPDASHSSFE